RNALLPSITVLALDFGRLMGGIVVVETIFAYPGLGRLVVFSIQNRDIPTLQAAILVVAAIYAFANLVADPLSAVLHPKIRLGNGVGGSATNAAQTVAAATQGGARDHRRHHRARAAGALDRAASVGHDLDAHAFPAAERHLLVRHR